MRNLDGVEIDEGAIQQFQARLDGRMIRPDDDGYDDARKIWNAMIDKRPAMIVRCSGVADVIDAVNFARENRLLLAVRGAGHNIAGTSLCDGGLVIDLSGMKGIWMDLGARTVRVQPGVTLGDLDRETQAFGLIVPGGIVSTTGISGLTLGGGLGWLTRKYGYTCDHLLSADVVTADGSFVTASERENADLFWGIRGGGGNFGVVTSYQYRMYPLGPTVMAGMVVHPMERAPEVIDLYRELTASAPDELSLGIVLRIAPPAPFLPREIHGLPIAFLAACYAGPIEEGEEAVRPLKQFGRPLVDLLVPKPFTAHQKMLDATQPPGRYYYWKSDYMREIGEETRDAMVSHTRDLPSPQSLLFSLHLGGAMGRIGEDATAASHRDSSYILIIMGSWLEPPLAERCIGWARDLWSAVHPFSLGGTYVNFLTADEGQDRVLAAYGPEKYARLVELKNKYDPENLFRMNQNVKPTAGKDVESS